MHDRHCLSVALSVSAKNELFRNTTDEMRFEQERPELWPRSASFNQIALEIQRGKLEPVAIRQGSGSCSTARFGRFDKCRGGFSPVCCYTLPHFGQAQEAAALYSALSNRLRRLPSFGEFLARCTVMEKPLSLLLVLAFVLVFGFSRGNTDYEALKAFKASTDSGNKLVSWKKYTNPCNGSWFGVICQHDRVIRVVLQNLNLVGPVDPLVGLDQLRVLSLKGNSLNGTIPDPSNWRSLKFLFLSYNQFSGPLPATISSLDRIRRLDVSNNNLSGQVPSSLNNLSHLLTLRLENNAFSGSIAELNLTSLQDFNISGNHLVGAIPEPLSKFSSSSFDRNVGLCGSPLSRCMNSTISSNPSTPGSNSTANSNPVIVPSTPTSKPDMTPSQRSSSKLSKNAIIAIVVGDFAVLFLITCICLCYYWKKYARKMMDGKPAKRLETERTVYSSSQYSQNSSSQERGRLVFFEGTKQFELEDLLRASAEMLGKGNFGTAYKAALEDSSVVVVKRLKDAHASGRRDFQELMELLGRLRHPNLVSLKAYYYAKDEKLLVYDYLPNGNLYSLLHGNRGPGRTPLDWTTRIKIALDAARGLAFIHHSCKSPKIAHGNVKSSNVLLDKDGNASISDFGLAVLVSPSIAASRMAGYRAPEQIESRKISQRADVYSFGVILLEILTGKAPVEYQVQEGNGLDLPNWVQSVVREEWTAEVFDLELMRYKNIEEELVAMLQIAMVCVSPSSEQRPKMSHVVKMIEDIREDHSPTHDCLNSVSRSPSLSDDTGTGSH
eukprot:Gb_19492 [translate_table: standard]